MSEREDHSPGDGGSATGQIMRMFRDDLGDEVKFVGLFVLVMVPAGLIGYLVDGSTGAIAGALVGAALVVLWLAVSATRIAIGWLRRPG